MCFQKTNDVCWPYTITALPIVDDSRVHLYRKSSTSSALGGYSSPHEFSSTKNRKVVVTPLEEINHQHEAKNIEPNRQCALHLACQKDSPLEVIQILLDSDQHLSEASSTLWASDNDGNIPLMTAIQYGCRIETINALIAAKPSTLTARNLYGKTPLHLAVEYACKTVVSHTTDSSFHDDGGNYMNQEGEMGYSAKATARTSITTSATNTTRTVKRLAAPFGSHPDQVEHDTNALEIVRLIVNMCPEALDLGDKAYDSTPLHSLITSDGPGQIETLRTLLSVLLLDEDEREDTETDVDQLPQYLCTRYKRKFDQMTPLNLACQPQYYHFELISILVEVCDPMTIIDFPNSHGFTPLQYMCDPFLHFDASSSLTPSSFLSTTLTPPESSTRKNSYGAGTVSKLKASKLREYATALSFADINTLLLEMIQALMDHRNDRNRELQNTDVMTATPPKNKEQHALWMYLQQRHYDLSSLSSTASNNDKSSTNKNDESRLSLIPKTVLKQLPWPINPKVVYLLTKTFPPEDLLHRPCSLISRTIGGSDDSGNMNVTHLATVNAILSPYPRVAVSPTFVDLPTPISTATFSGTTCLDPEFACLYIILLTDYCQSSPVITQTDTMFSQSPPLKVTTDVVTTIKIWQSQQAAPLFSESTRRLSDFQSNNNIRCILRMVVHIMFATVYKTINAFTLKDTVGADDYTTRLSSHNTKLPPSVLDLIHQVSEDFLLGGEMLESSDIDEFEDIGFFDEAKLANLVTQFCDDTHEGETLTKALLLPSDVMSLDLFQMIFPTPPVRSIGTCLENAIRFRQSCCQRHQQENSLTLVPTLHRWNTSIVAWLLTVATRAMTSDSATQQDRRRYRNQIIKVLDLLTKESKTTPTNSNSDSTKDMTKDEIELLHILEESEKNYCNESDNGSESTDENGMGNQESESQDDDEEVGASTLNENDMVEDYKEVSKDHSGADTGDHPEGLLSLQSGSVPGEALPCRREENPTLTLVPAAGPSMVGTARSSTSIDSRLLSSPSTTSAPIVSTRGTIEDPISQQVQRPGQKCRGCSTTLETEWRFCPFCGSTDGCRSCGTQIRPGWRFCPCCGLQQ